MADFNAKVTRIKNLVNARVRDEDKIQAAYEALDTNEERVAFQEKYPDLFAKVTTRDAVIPINPAPTAPPPPRARLVRLPEVSSTYQGAEKYSGTGTGRRHRRRKSRKTVKKAKKGGRRRKMSTRRCL